MKLCHTDHNSGANFHMPHTRSGVVCFCDQPRLPARLPSGLQVGVRSRCRRVSRGNLGSRFLMPTCYLLLRDPSAFSVRSRFQICYLLPWRPTIFPCPPVLPFPCGRSRPEASPLCRSRARFLLTRGGSAERRWRLSECYPRRSWSLV